MYFSDYFDLFFFDNRYVVSVLSHIYVTSHNLQKLMSSVLFFSFFVLTLLQKNGIFHTVNMRAN